MKYAILSGYIQKRFKSSTIRLAVNSRRIYNIIKNNPKMKVKVINEKLFEIEKSNTGKKMKFRNKDFSIAINKNILTSKHIKNLSKITKKDSICFPILVKIKPSDFGVTYFDLYPDQDSAQLAKEIYKYGAQLPERIITSHSFNYDLEFYYNKKHVALELTKTKVSKNSTANFRHQTLGSRIQSNIFDMYRRCTKSILKENKKIFSFVIISQEWKNIKHVKNMIHDCENVGCFIIFTDFSRKSWPKYCASEVIKALES